MESKEEKAAERWAKRKSWHSLSQFDNDCVAFAAGIAWRVKEEKRLGVFEMFVEASRECEAAYKLEKEAKK